MDVWSVALTLSLHLVVYVRAQVVLRAGYVGLGGTSR